MAAPKIHILSVIGTPNAILQKFGLQVFDEAKQYLSKGEHVKISFKGLMNVTSGFCNASIGKLYLEFPEAYKLVEITDVNQPVWMEKINDAILLATNPNLIKIQDNAITELFV